MNTARNVSPLPKRQRSSHIPSLDTCVLAIPRNDIVQCCGRILRYHPSKQVPRVIDFVDDASVFHAQARKRVTYYKKLKANITKLNEDLEENVVVVEETQEKHRQQTFPFQR
ncbi:unnamed protein product [Sphacelaria rigidula]